MKEDHGILKIYASSTDRIASKLLYEFIVRLARENGISGVTVYKDIMGYGLSSKIGSAKLPIVIEIVDTIESLGKLYQLIEPELKKCLKDAWYFLNQ